MSVRPRHATMTSMLRSRRSLSVCLSGASVTLLVLACTTDYQKGLDDPNYGSPNALEKRKPPGPSSSPGAEITTTPPAPECAKAGGALVDGGGCQVSFKTDILEAFKAANCQQAGCHGAAAGQSPQTEPRIDPADGPATWAELSAFKGSNGKLYINPCSTDPAQSAIACSVNPTATCGVLMPPGSGLSSDTVTKIETWVKCGAPNN